MKAVSKHITNIFTFGIVEFKGKSEVHCKYTEFNAMWNARNVVDLHRQNAFQNSSVKQQNQV